jgi:phosphoadenosine phosphosulfate reductase
MDKLDRILQEIEEKSLEDSFKAIYKHFGEKIIFTTSFGVEDQVITDMIFKYQIPIRLSTIDTGRMFEETYKVFNRTRSRYNCEVEVFFPDKIAVEQMMSTKGPLSFYESVENRKECCNIRKVEPLKRALAGNECWVTGIRRDQNEHRTDMKILEWDEGYGIYKFNPLIDWSLDEVANYIKTNNIPYNHLFDKGFVSIGCEPCTRAIEKGEDFRAGRWWWENNSGKECGLHTHGK